MFAIVVQDIVVVCVVVENVAVVVVGVAIRGSNAIDFGVAIVPFNIFFCRSKQASKQTNERTNGIVQNLFTAQPGGPAVTKILLNFASFQQGSRFLFLLL